MRAWGYCYIENLTWVYLRPNNHILELPSRYANSSHITLYMFRREGGFMWAGGACWMRMISSGVMCDLSSQSSWWL